MIIVSFFNGGIGTLVLQLTGLCLIKITVVGVVWGVTIGVVTRGRVNVGVVNVKGRVVIKLGWSDVIIGGGGNVIVGRVIGKTRPSANINVPGPNGGVKTAFWGEIWPDETFDNVTFF